MASPPKFNNTPRLPALLFDDVTLSAMKLRHIYLLLCVVGIVLPYWQFVPWVAAHGLDLTLFLRELFATRIGAFFGMDVVVSALALVVFVSTEGGRLRIRGRWFVVVALFLVGVSLALPLFLYLRQRQLDAAGPEGTS